jgi:hypothetical protein
MFIKYNGLDANQIIVKQLILAKALSALFNYRLLNLSLPTKSE